MSDALVRIVLFIVLFCAGVTVRRLKKFPDTIPELLLKVIFYVGLPIAIFWSILSTPLSFDSVFLPLSSLLVISITGLFSFVVGKLFKLKPKQLGVLIVSTMILNTGFTMPFFGAFYGNAGIAALAIYDLGNTFLLFTVVYFIALSMGHVKGGTRLILRKLISAPSLWVIAVAGILSFKGYVMPAEVSSVLSYFNYFLFMLVMFTLGMLFKPHVDHFKWIALGIGLRTGLGLILGILVSNFFGLNGVERMAVIIGSASPNGYTTLIYASIAKLDKHYAASLVSASLVVGIILLPVLLYFLK
jgi:predicted permease